MMTRKDKLFFISLLPLSSSLLTILVLSIATVALKSELLIKASELIAS
jgi:hypothetical protein